MTSSFSRCSVSHRDATVCLDEVPPAPVLKRPASERSGIQSAPSSDLDYPVRYSWLVTCKRCGNEIMKAGFSDIFRHVQRSPRFSFFVFHHNKWTVLETLEEKRLESARTDQILANLELSSFTAYIPSQMQFFQPF